MFFSIPNPTRNKSTKSQTVKPIKTIDEFNAGMAQAKDKLVIIYFYSPHGKENHRIDAILDQMAEKYGSKLLVLTVDFDTEFKVFGIMRNSETPTFTFYKNFEHVEHFSGADVQKFEQTITNLINWENLRK